MIRGICESKVIKKVDRLYRIFTDFTSREEQGLQSIEEQKEKKLKVAGIFLGNEVGRTPALPHKNKFSLVLIYIPPILN